MKQEVVVKYLFKLPKGYCADSVITKQNNPDEN